MTEPASGSTPDRKRSRRFLVVVALLVLAFAGWRFAMSESVADRARMVRIGQPRENVLRLMGQPQMTYGTVKSVGECYTDMTAVELTLRVLIHQYLGLNVLPDFDGKTVRFEYDSNRCVERIILPD